MVPPSSYANITLNQIIVDQTLPVTIYIFLDSRFLAFRGEGDVIDRGAYDKLEFKKIKDLFVAQEDFEKFQLWSQKHKSETAAQETESLAPPTLASAREDAKRAALDIFQTEHPEPAVRNAIVSSRKLVAEIVKLPFAVKSLTQLQTYSKGTVDHSVNVSILSVYLGLQMGYSHNLILQHLALGALLHDIGKRKVVLEEDESKEVQEAKMKDHPTLGMRILETMENVPKEVLTIVAQHHEYADGTGYPKKLRGNAIYDLSRIVSIANLFDELVGEGNAPTLVQRQREALRELSTRYTNKFDAEKLDKSLRILKLGV